MYDCFYGSDAPVQVNPGEHFKILGKYREVSGIQCLSLIGVISVTTGRSST